MYLAQTYEASTRSQLGYALACRLYIRFGPRVSFPQVPEMAALLRRLQNTVQSYEKGSPEGNTESSQSKSRR